MNHINPVLNQNIIISVDIVMFTIQDDKLKILLLKRHIEPYIWFWALPGTPIRQTETAEWSVGRMLYEKLWLSKIYYEQLYTFTWLARDPRNRAVSLSFMSVSRNFGTPKWEYLTQYHEIKKLPPMAFDHQEIIRYAYQRLKYKLEYTNIAQHFLAKYFTLTELQNIYEVILGYTFDTRNFRKKIKSLNIVKPTGKKQDNVKNRPAELYEFVNKKLEIKEIL